MSNSFGKRVCISLAAVTFASVLTAPGAALAKSLCIDLGAYDVVLSKVSAKAGKSFPVSGFYSNGSSGYPVFGSMVVGSDGTQFAFALQRGAVWASTMGLSTSTAANGTIVFGFVQSDTKLNVGDTGNGAADGVSATPTIIDCATAETMP